MSSAKWRAMQHRHRYTYGAVEIPSTFSAALSASPVSHNSKSCVFFKDLTHLAQLNVTYSQVAHSKSLASSFSRCVSIIDLQNDDDRFLLVSISLFYLHLLFLENSFPLHRVLLSGLFKVGDKDVQGVLCDCFSQLFEEYSNAVHGKTKRFCLSRVALSVMGMPKLHYLASVVERHAGTVACDVVQGLEGVISETEDSARPSPIVLEQCQEGLSCLYYLIQRFPGKFKGEGMSIINRVLNALLRVLKSTSFSRDCFVSAGVSFCAALQVCLSMEELGQLILEGVFREKSCKIRNSCCDETASNTLTSKVPFKGDLFGEIRTISSLSRLCLMRGILTALPRQLLNFHFIVIENSAVKTILFDEILPELCSYGENPPDSHFNFHSLTVLQICLQQIKASIEDKVADISGNSSLISDDMSTRILSLIWKNLEDPLSQTVKQVHLIFDIFLDIMATEKEGIKIFLRKITTNLLQLGPRCKGRYVPLSLLTKRLGAKVLLGIRQSLLNDNLLAYIDDDVCCAATTFLKCFLESLRDQCWESDGVENGYESLRNHCLFPFLSGLASGVSKLRSNINTYALPVLLEVDEGIIFSMLDVILVGAKIGIEYIEYDVEQKVAILISLLKVSRSRALLEGDIDSEGNSCACVRIKGINVSVPVEWLEIALTHVDDFLRVDAAELLFLNPKTSTIPSTLELLLLRKAIPLNMRSISTGFQMKWTSLFRKFFSRVRTALERQHKLGALNDKQMNEEETTHRRAKDLFFFLKWLSSFLFFSCNPSAPYKRKIMAMDLILIMLNVWPIVSSSANGFTSYLYPYSNGISSNGFTSLLVGSIIDSWDKLRESSVRILQYYPTPLPGISLEKDVVQLISWTKILVCSPRVRESDAGAQTFQLIFTKYVVEMKCLIRVSPEVSCSMSVHENSVFEYMSSLVHWLNGAVLDGERDLLESCSNCFVHGILLTLRYTFEEFDWNSNYLISTTTEMKLIIQSLLELISRITSIALWVVSAGAWYLPNEDEDFKIDDLDLDEIHEQEDDFSNDEMGKRSQEQIVMVGCWLAMKEVSLLLETIIRKIPLPSSSRLDSPSIEILNVEQLKHIGNHFLEVLLKMKHNGAIDKTRAGFSALCNRLLCSNDPKLCSLTDSWMVQLMERTTAKGQVVDDLLRRSAGIPAAFMALFLSEPEGAPKKLLPRALRWLIDLCSSLLNEEIDCCSTLSPSDSKENYSKTRKEGVVSIVHAFNVLRSCFNDANLSVDTSGFAAEALILSIRSFSSPHWEIRNSACLAYTSLVRRIIGFMNPHKKESARRSLTGLEFFHRYPSLHPFVFNELQIATDSLIENYAESNLAKDLHPSLCPLLILLSRLKPSSIASETGDPLDPFLFLPFIKKCSMQSNMRIRVLSSEAITCLVSNEKLPSVLLSIASELHSLPSSFNTVHGILLQLSNLVDSNCRNLADSIKKEKIINDLVGLVAKYEWIGTPSVCLCPTLVASYLKLLDFMLDVLRSGEKGDAFLTLHSLLLKLSGQCLETEVSYGLSFYDPTITETRKHAATSHLNCLMYLPKDSSRVSRDSDISLPFPAISERILRCVVDPSYEVRLATLKWLLRFVKFSGTSQWVDSELQLTLMELLDREKHHKCVYYLLKLLFELGNLGCEKVQRFWEKLVFMYQINRHAKTKQQIIRCFATCVKYFSDQLFALVSSFETERAPELFDMLRFFVDEIEKQGSSCEPASMRRAAVDSLVSSGLLEMSTPLSRFVTNHELSSQKCSPVNMYGKLVLKAWFICVKLLEDEDDVVRESLALAVQKQVSAETTPTQVGKVIHLCFNHLSSVFGKWVCFFDHVCEFVYKEATFSTSNVHLVRRLFDREIDNHHEDKLFVCQLSCFHLEKLDLLFPGTSTGVDFQDYLRTWRLKFLRRCVDLGECHSQREMGAWIGGVGNHKDSFFPLYGNMLGFYALSKCVLGGEVEDKRCLVDDVGELGKGIRPFLKNSLISCLFMSIVDVHEKKFGLSSDCRFVDLEDDDLWNVFDPYFLFN